MVFWFILVVACLVLYYAPTIIFDIIINLFKVILMLIGEFFKCVYHGAIGASGTVWIILDLPNQVEMGMSARASHVDRIQTPSEVPVRDDAVDNGVSSSAAAADHTISDTPRKKVIQRCAGYTVSGSRCKRETTKPDDAVGIWYCRDHLKQSLE